MKYQGIIFDLDGVICFTDEYHYEAWKRMADDMGIPFDRQVNNRLRGVSRMDSLEIILEKYEGPALSQADKEALAAKKNDIYRESLARMSPADLSAEVRETLEALRSSARSSAAKSQAAAIIGSRALSKKELTKRLVKKGSGQEDAQAAADWLEDIGAVDDGAYAASLVRHYGGRGYGPARVREELRRRGVDQALWEEALEEMPDPAEILDKLIQKRCRGDLSDPRERRRTSDALLRRGFAWRDVKAAMGRYAEMEEDGWE